MEVKRGKRIIGESDSTDPEDGLELILSPFEEHLLNLREEVTAYLQNEHNPAIRPPQPEALGMYYMMSNFSLPPVDGGFLDQPYCLMRELQVCQECTQTHLIAKAQETT